MAVCTLCPRRCGRDREKERGLCGAGDALLLARAAPHFWEEPCLSGTRGSGALFFSGCTLRCAYCQNYEISRAQKGFAVSDDRFIEILFALKEKGVHNINLVTADPYVARLAPLLKKVKKELALPVVFNGSGYESEEMLTLLDGAVDVYLPDCKYADAGLAKRLSGAPDYPDVVRKALRRMYEQVGKPRFDKEGILQKGVLVRHLVLPGCRADSLAVLALLGKLFRKDEILLSLMSQFTPNGRAGGPSRRLTRFEYESVAAYAKTLGFDGYFQDFSSQSAQYTPSFEGEGVTEDGKGSA